MKDNLNGAIDMNKLITNDDKLDKRLSSLIDKLDKLEQVADKLDGKEIDVQLSTVTDEKQVKKSVKKAKETAQKEADKNTITVKAKAEIPKNNGKEVVNAIEKDINDKLAKKVKVNLKDFLQMDVGTLKKELAKLYDSKNFINGSEKALQKFVGMYSSYLAKGGEAIEEYKAEFNNLLDEKLIRQTNDIPNNKKLPAVLKHQLELYQYMVEEVNNLHSSLTAVANVQKQVDTPKVKSDYQNGILSENESKRIEKASKDMHEIYRSYNKMNGIKGEKGISWFSDDFETMETYLKQFPDREVIKGNLDFSKLLNIDAQGALHNAITHLGDGSDEASKKITDVYNRIQELKTALDQKPSEALTTELRELELEYDKLSEDTSNLYGTHTTNWFALQAQEAGYLGVAIRNVIDDYNGLIDKPTTTIALFDLDKLENSQRITEEIKGNVKEISKIAFDIKGAINSDLSSFMNEKEGMDLEEELREVEEFNSLMKLTEMSANDLASALREVFAYAHENPDVLSNLYDYDARLVDTFDETTNIGKYFKSMIDSTDWGVDEESLDNIYLDIAEKLQAYEKEYISQVTLRLKEALSDDKNGVLPGNNIDAEIDKLEEKKSLLESIKDILTVHEDFHGNDAEFAFNLPSEEDIRRADAMLKETFDNNPIFDVDKLISDRNDWLNEVKYSLDEYQNLLKSNNQEGLDEYSIQGLSRISGAESFFGYEDNSNTIASVIAQEREKIDVEIGRLYNSLDEADSKIDEKIKDVVDTPAQPEVLPDATLPSLQKEESKIEDINEDLEKQSDLYKQIYERVEKIRMLGVVGADKNDENDILNSYGGESRNIKAFQMQMDAIKTLSPTGKMNPNIRDMVLSPELSIEEVTKKLVEAAEEYVTCKNALDNMFTKAGITGGNVYDEAYRNLSMYSIDSEGMFRVIGETREKLAIIKSETEYREELRKKKEAETQAQVELNKEKIEEARIQAELTRKKVYGEDNQPEVLSGNTLPLQDITEELEFIETKEDEVIAKTKTMYRAFNSEHGVNGKGISWFTDDLETAGTYFENATFSAGKKDSLAELTTDVSKFLSIDAQGAHWGEIMYEGISRSANELAEMAKQAGYVGLEIRNVYDSVNGIDSDLMSNVYTIFDDNIVKDAEDKTKSLKDGLTELSQIRNAIDEAMSLFDGRNSEIHNEARQSFAVVVSEYKNGAIDIKEALSLINESANSILSSNNKEFDFTNKVTELWKSLKSVSEFSNDIYKGYGSTNWKSIVQDFVNGTKTEEQALQELEVEFRNLLELKDATLKQEGNQTPLPSPTSEPSKAGEEARETAEEIEKADEQIEASNEEVEQSEEELAKKTKESREKSSNAAKEHADEVEKAKDRIVKANEEVKNSEKQSSDSDGKEVFNAEELAIASEKAADAKIEVKNANEQVQESVDGSKSKLELETELMERLATAARDAADAKKEFVEANKQVSDSVDGTKKKTEKKDKYADNKKVSEEDFDATYYSSIANENLKSKGYTILGNSVNAELVDGLVKVTAKVKDAEGSWKSFTAKIDGDGKLLGQRFTTVTKKVNELEEALENLENESKPALTLQEISEQVKRLRNELNLGENEFSIKVDETGFVTIIKRTQETKGEVQNLKQEFESVDEAINNFAVETSNLARSTDITVKSKKESNEKKITSPKKDDFEELSEKIIKADKKLLILKNDLEESKKIYREAFDTTPIDKQIVSIKEEIEELERQIEKYKEQEGYLDRIEKLKKDRKTAIDTQQNLLDMDEAKKAARTMLKGDSVGKFSDFESAKVGAKRYAETLGEVTKEFQYLEDKSGTGIRTMTTEIQTATGEVKKLVFSWRDGTSDMTVSTKMLRTELKGLPGLIQEIGHKAKQLAIYWFANAFNPMDLLNYGRTWFTFANQYDDALTEMMKVSNETIGVLQDFQKESFKLADSVGTTAQQLQSSTADFLRLGESLEEAKQSAQDANILFNVSEFGSITEATDSLISMSQAYKELEKSEINDILNFAGNNFSLSTSDLATALKDAAAVLKTQGNDIYEAVALITAGNAITQDPLKTAGGVRTISLRIAGTEEAKAELESLGESVDDYIVQTESKTQETIKNLTAVASNAGKGIDVLDANGNLRNTYDILLDISKIYKEIQEEDKKAGTNRANALVEYLAGKNRSNIASSILLNSDLLEEVKNRTMSESENSSQEELDRYLESISGHVAKLQNQWQNLWAETANRDLINFFLDAATSVLKFADEVGFLNVILFGSGGLFAAIRTIQGNGRPKCRVSKKNMPLVA